LFSINFIMTNAFFGKGNCTSNYKHNHFLNKGRRVKTICLEAQ
jgi:hypothetical protein